MLVKLKPVLELLAVLKGLLVLNPEINVDEALMTELNFELEETSVREGLLVLATEKPLLVGPVVVSLFEVPFHLSPEVTLETGAIELLLLKPLKVPAVVLADLEAVDKLLLSFPAKELRSEERVGIELKADALELRFTEVTDVLPSRGY